MMSLSGYNPAEAPNSGHIRIMRFSTFVFHHTSHPWSQHGVLVWMVSSLTTQNLTVLGYIFILYFGNVISTLSCLL